MFGQSSLRSLHSLTRSLSSGEGVKVAASAATSKTPPDIFRYTPPRRLGSSLQSQSSPPSTNHNLSSAGRSSGAGRLPMRGVDSSRVALPRERHLRGRETSSSSDNDRSMFSDYYGLMSLSTGISDISSVTNCTSIGASAAVIDALAHSSSSPPIHSSLQQRQSQQQAPAITTTPTPNSTTTNMVEISPGVLLPLRGAEETRKAIQAGFYVQCECLACSAPKLHCVLDCDCFLCPDCRSVTPNPLKCGDGGGDEYNNGGLGLGFRLNEV